MGHEFLRAGIFKIAKFPDFFASYCESVKPSDVVCQFSKLPIGAKQSDRKFIVAGRARTDL